MEIKFRGLRTDGKGWAYGDLLHNAFDGTSKCVPFGIREKQNGHYNYPVEVTPETVGMFTGLHDKNGKEVFRKDLVNRKNKIYIVDWNKLHASWGLFNINGYQTKEELLCDFVDEKGNTPKLWQDSSIEIIGNIFEHSELLK